MQKPRFQATVEKSEVATLRGHRHWPCAAPLVRRRPLGGVPGSTRLALSPAVSPAEACSVWG